MMKKQGAAPIFGRLRVIFTVNCKIPCLNIAKHYASASSTPRSSFHVRCTEGMDIFSRGVWISSRSGPKDTQSSPGSLPENRPHSNPAWEFLI